MKIAMLQMPVGFDKEENIRKAAEAVAWAGAREADIAILPEMWNCPYSNQYFPGYAEEGIGMTRAALADMARRNNLWLVGGSIPEKEDGKVYNTSFVYDPEGREVARHRKVHLFDIDVKGGQRFFESETFTPGDSITTFETPWGKMGLCICFDMRFPELARVMALEGAQAVLVPAAFNMTTGPAHWETMFRQRAVDNQIFTVGVSPARDEQGVYVAYGNSIVVDPWGTVVSRMDGAEDYRIVELDMGRVADVRAQLPLMSARRTDLYKVERR